MRTNHASGFTLIELCLTCALITVLFALTWPMMSHFGTGSRLENGAHEIASLAAYARDTALFEACRYRLDFDVINNRYSLAVEDSPADNPGHFAVVNDSFHRARALPRGITMTAVSRPSMLFSPDGSSEDISITLSSMNGDALGVRIEGVSGKCTIENK